MEEKTMKRRNLWRPFTALLAGGFLCLTLSGAVNVDVQCSYGGCVTEFAGWDDGTWALHITCDDGSSWNGGGQGGWEGSLCGGAYHISIGV